MTTLPPHQRVARHPGRAAHVARLRPSPRRVLAGSLAGTAAAAVVLYGYGALAIAVHGPMQAGDAGAATASPVQASSFSVGVVFTCCFGTLLALAIARWGRRPARTFLRVATVLTIASLAAPLAASHTDDSTRLLLGGGHLVAALIVIPTIVATLREPSTVVAED